MSKRDFQESAEVAQSKAVISRNWAQAAVWCSLIFAIAGYNIIGLFTDDIKTPDCETQHERVVTIKDKQYDLKCRP